MNVSFYKRSKAIEIIQAIIFTHPFQEVYLSEHNYDEALDMETAKTILNFGDDYRNFIESNSEVQSPRFAALEKKKKNSRSKVCEISYNRVSFSSFILF